MGTTPKKTTKKRGRKLLLLGLVAAGVAAFKASRDQDRAAPAAPAAPVPPTPAPVPADPVAETPVVEAAPDPLPEPLLEDLLEEPAVEESTVVSPPTAASVAAAAGLDDIVDELWNAESGDAVTPVEEPPADSLSSFFDEVMTDTDERKLRKGR